MIKFLCQKCTDGKLTAVVKCSFIWSSSQERRSKTDKNFLNNPEKTAICARLREMIDSLRQVRQDTTDPFIGSSKTSDFSEI